MMELMVDVKYEEVLKLVKQLPAAKIRQLKSALDEKFIEKKANREISDFQKFLLSAPVMTDSQLKTFKENRKHFNQWRQN